MVQECFQTGGHFEAEKLPVEHIISVDNDFEVSEYVEGEMVHHINGR
jgi:hypothetical protein